LKAVFRHLFLQKWGLLTIMDTKGFMQRVLYHRFFQRDLKSCCAHE